MIPDAQTLDHFLTDVVTPDWHFQHDAGRPFAETSAELGVRYPEHRDLIARWGPEFGATITGPVAGMTELVEALDAADVPLFGITNFSAEFWPPFRAREAALFDRFRDIVVSGEERLVKPDPTIYALALDRFGLAPGEGLFVDDRDDNVRAAEAAGFPGHHFADAPTLKRHLESLGILSRFSGGA